MRSMFDSSCRASTSFFFAAASKTWMAGTSHDGRARHSSRALVGSLRSLGEKGVGGVPGNEKEKAPPRRGVTDEKAGSGGAFPSSSGGGAREFNARSHAGSLIIQAAERR